MFLACASSRYQLKKLECFKHTLVVGAATPRQAEACPCCALAPVRKCAYFLFSLSCHTVVACLCAHSPPARMLMSSHHLGSSSMKNIIHFHGSGAFALTHKILALSCRWNKRTSVWGLQRASSMNCKNSYSEFLQDARRCIKN